MVKTITIHLDEETWKEYDTIKTEAQLTWDQVVEHGIKSLQTGLQEKRGEF